MPLDCNVLFFDCYVVATGIISLIKLDSNWYPDGIIFSIKSEVRISSNQI